MHANLTMRRLAFQVPLLLATLLLALSRPAASSGIFEISLSSLTDSFGRDLRDDCCSWQAAQQPAAVQRQHNNHLNYHNMLHQNHQNHQNPNSNQQQQNECDPSKCQLNVKICVTNYQSRQIEASQCTFGALTAQVLSASDSQQPYVASQYVQQVAQQQQAAATPLRYRAASSAGHQQRLAYMQHEQRVASTAPLRQQQLQANATMQLHTPTQSYLGSAWQSPSRGLGKIAFQQPITFPFNYTWPKYFSLVIEAWYESPSRLPVPLVGVAANASYSVYRQQPIIKHSIRHWLEVKDEWTQSEHRTETAALSYAYRVTCQQNYFGAQCNKLCRVRDDIYGHNTCSADGDIQCRPGWSGDYCDEPICSPGCHKDQGNCSRPNECNCRLGWQGAQCEQCVPHPNCVHGSCNRPHECNCEPGWTGLLCNIDLNVCNKQQPCKNAAQCQINVDSDGLSGGYNCTCLPGFSGKNCERLAPSQPRSLASQQLSQNTNHYHQQHQQQLQAELGRETATTITTTLQTLTLKPRRPMPSANFASMAQQQQHQHQQQQQHRQLDHFQQQQQQNQTQLDNWAAMSYVIIIACGAFLFGYTLLQCLALCRRNGSHWWRWQLDSNSHDVATMQNQQNIYKSRASLGAGHKLPFSDETLDAASDLSLAGRDSEGYGCSSGVSYASSRSDLGQQHQQHHQSALDALGAGYARAHHFRRHADHYQLSGRRVQHHRSQHNLQHQHQRAPPPPYTISHSHPNSMHYAGYGASLYGHRVNQAQIYGSAAPAPAHFPFGATTLPAVALAAPATSQTASLKAAESKRAERKAGHKTAAAEAPQLPPPPPESRGLGGGVAGDPNANVSTSNSTSSSIYYNINGANLNTSAATYQAPTCYVIFANPPG